MSTVSPPSFEVDTWAFSSAHGELVRILDVETVWNHTVDHVWVPRLGTAGSLAAKRKEWNGFPDEFG